MSSTDRGLLNAAKLRAIVKARWGDEERTPVPYAGGAALVGASSELWVLAETDPSRSLGPALRIGGTLGADAIHILVDDPGAAAVLARRAALFASPPVVSVWVYVGLDSLDLARPAAVVWDEVPSGLWVARFSGIILDAGADVILEPGVLLGEVKGLEVARSGFDAAGVPRLEVGVGRHDREAHAELERARAAAGSAGVEADLAAVVVAVSALRVPGAPLHPANTLRRERWLRWALCADPSIAGMAGATLAPVAPIEAPPDLRQPSPAPAIGHDADGHPIVVVCSAGIDVDLVAAAADMRAAHGDRGAKLVLVVPAGDDHPVHRVLAAALSPPAALVAVTPPWLAP